MEKVMYFIAEDGKQFEDAWECEQYEEKLHIKNTFEPFSCYDKEGCFLNTDDEDFNPEDVYYILVKECNYEDGSYMELDSFIFEGLLPYIGNTFKNTDTALIYFDNCSNTWRNWHEEFNKLNAMMQMFQLFEGEGE